jgi:hypothetical protein
MWSPWRSTGTDSAHRGLKPQVSFAVYFLVYVPQQTGGVVMRKIILGAAAIAASTSALAERSIITPSGQPEAVFYKTTVAEAGAKLASTCMDLGWQVSAQTSNQVTCEVPMGMWQSVMTQMLIGNSYSTTPKGYVAINLVQLNDNVRAQGRAWAQTQMAFGQMQEHQYTDDGTFNNLLGFMGKAGGVLPIGTRFTGTYLGFENEDASNNTSGLNITVVYPTSPAERAGMKVGDQVVRIDGKGFKNATDFSKKLANIRTATYPVTVRRNGQEMVLTLTREARPTVGSPEWHVLMAGTPAEAATAAAQRP